MARPGAALSLVVAAALAAAVIPRAADAAGSPAKAGASAEARAAASTRAIIEVAVPGSPVAAGAADGRERRRLRARAARVLDSVSERRGLEAEARIPETGQLAVALEGESVAELRARLAADPRVISVRRDRPVQFRYSPNDFGFNRLDPNAPGGDFGQWNLTRSGAAAAWDLSTGSGAEVAVIDSGADLSHPDLAGRVAGTLDCSPDCSPGGVADAAGHGTHVSGLACADSDNFYGVASLGFDCGLFVARVTLCSSVSQAIVHAANRGSDAINLSVGGCAAGVAPAIDYAWASGSVPVAAGTNSPSPAGDNYPAERVQPEGSGPDLSSGKGLVVTAAKYSGRRAAFAQASTGVSVAAFGAATDFGSGGQQGILSTWPAATTTIDTGSLLPPVPPCNCRTSLAGDDRFAYLVGTSMAAPQVAGLVALMRAAAPALTAPKLVRLVKLSARNCAEYGDGVGWGLIDAHAAVASALGRDVTPPVSHVRRVNRKQLLLKRFTPARCSPELPSAAIKAVNVFVSANGKPFRRIGKTTAKRIVFGASKKKRGGRKGATSAKRRGKGVRFAPKRGRRYRFYTVAVDADGNREAAPGHPDAKLKLKKKRRKKKGR